MEKKDAASIRAKKSNLKETFYSNGKLLLTGEYLILDGAKALALPTKFGQDLSVEPGPLNQIIWKSYDHDGAIWFEDILTFDEIAKKQINPAFSIKSTLIEILHVAYKQNPGFMNSDKGYQIETHLTFPRLWGLGTSSTLLNNIAQWLKIDPYVLLRESFGGSGYDIACANNDSAIIYHLENNQPQVEPINFNPQFRDNIWFVYLNRKQSSKAAIASYYTNRVHDIQERIDSINRITSIISTTDNPGIFAREIENHESIISDILEMETVRESFFQDFHGSIKSLGGWGGDFILAMSKEDPSEYFYSKGFMTVIRYRDMIL